MAHKIFISPSDQTSNKYAWGDTSEAIQCGKIGDALYNALTRCGFDVKLIQYETMAAKAKAADAWGAELYIPIHTNACNGKVSGTRMFCVNTTGEGYKACKAIFAHLAPLTPGTSEAIKVNADLYEIRVPRAPTAYCECDFHDVPEVAEWIIGHTVEIAEAICRGVCDHFGEGYVEPETEKRYTVRLGGFERKEDAEALAALLAGAVVVEA